jgi:type I restriction enzyme S subunit
VSNKKWPESRLKDSCEYVTVGHVGPMAEYYVDEGIPFLRSQNIQAFRLNTADIKFITPSFHQKLKKSALRPGDVAIVRTGYPGTACVIPKSLPISNCSDLVIIRPSESLDPFYLAALFNSSWGRQTVAGNLVGVAQQHFNVGAAKEMLVHLPPLPIQRKIAAILSAYDDLIENNTRRIAILEEMAQAIYREWFVNFRFPGHENVKLVDSALGQIPERWEACTIKDVCESTSYGFTASASQEEVGPKFLRITDIVPSTISWESVPFCKMEEAKVAKYTVEEGDVVVARTGATTGYAKRLNKRHPLTVYASYLVRLRPIQRLGKLFLGIIVESDDYKLFIKANLSGAAQPQANAQVLSSFSLPVPDETLIRKFDERVEPMLDQKEILEQKNRNLRTTRDLLLPKLISGQLDVEDLDIDVGMTAEELAEVAGE